MRRTLFLKSLLLSLSLVLTFTSEAQIKTGLGKMKHFMKTKKNERPSAAQKKDPIPSTIPDIEILDTMLIDLEALNKAAAAFGKICDKLDEDIDYIEENNQGIEAEDEYKKLSKTVDLLNRFENDSSVEIAQTAYDVFVNKYGDGYGAFGNLYIKEYHNIQTKISTIEDRDKRYQLDRQLEQDYKYENIKEPRKEYLQSNLGKLNTYKNNYIGNVIRNADVTGMTLPYQDDPATVDKCLSRVLRLLKLVHKLDPESEKIAAKINEMEAIGEEKKELIMKAWADNRFPKKYTGGDAPTNAAAVEKAAMVRFKKSHPDRPCYKAVVASGWRTILNVLGNPIYSEIDVYMAIQDPKHSKVANVDFFTFKTGNGNTKHSPPFATFSWGSFMDMYIENLNK